MERDRSLEAPRSPREERRGQVDATHHDRDERPLGGKAAAAPSDEPLGHGLGEAQTSQPESEDHDGQDAQAGKRTGCVGHD